jgi:hypothetical protein
VVSTTAAMLRLAGWQLVLTEAALALSLIHI